MLKVPLSNNDDVQEGLKLRKRAQFEEDRKKRIFNAKQRLFGVDIDYIERQLAERTKRQHIENECRRRYDDQIRIVDKALIAKDRELEKRQRILNSDLNYYRCRFQRKDQRREFDLNDPNALKNTKPLRVADDDLNLGLASCQIFAGEDLGFEGRKKRQHAQQRAWLDQQVKERQQAEDSKRAADEMWRQSMMERDKRLEDVVVSEQRVRDQMLNSVRQYNKNLARDKHLERIRGRQETIEDDMAEIYNMLTSNMLTEKSGGMTPEKKLAFRQEQDVQRAKAQERESQAKLMDAQWEQYALNIDRELKLKELQLAEREDKIVKELFEFNAKLAKEKQLEKDIEQKQLKGPGISDEFYQCFNTTTR